MTEGDHTTERFAACAALPDDASCILRVAAVMQDAWRIEKSGKNVQQGYTFAQESDITEMLRAAMGRAGLIMHCSIEREERYEARFRSSVGTGVILHMRYTLIGPNDQLPSQQWIGEATDNADKAVPKALTAAKKSFLVHTFLLSTGVDPDEGGEESSRSGARQQQQSADRSNEIATGQQIRGVFALARERNVDPEHVRLSAHLLTRTRENPDGLSINACPQRVIAQLRTMIESWTQRGPEWDERMGKMAARLDAARQPEESAAAEDIAGAASKGAKPPVSPAPEEPAAEPSPSEEEPAEHAPVCTCGKGPDVPADQHDESCSLSIPFG